MEIIILVGGKGTRLRSLVSDRPKPLADVNGKPFIEYIMDYLLQQGASHFILATGFMKKTFRTHFGDSYNEIPISFSEEESPLGTGGAIVKAQALLQENKPFFIVNGDTFFPIDLGQLQNFALASDSDIAIALCRANENGRYGAAKLNKENEIQLEKNAAAKGDLANGGICVLTRQIHTNLVFFQKPMSFETDLLPSLKDDGYKITGLPFGEYFIDVGTPQDYLKFSRDFASSDQT